MNSLINQLNQDIKRHKAIEVACKIIIHPSTFKKLVNSLTPNKQSREFGYKADLYLGTPIVQTKNIKKDTYEIVCNQ